MNSLLSLDSHFLFFEEAEKEAFDIDSFLSPAYDIIPPLEAVLITPFASPNKQGISDSPSVENEASVFQKDIAVSKLRRGQRKSESSKRQRKSESDTCVKELERRVAELIQENSKLKESVYTLTSDKERLESKIIFLQQMMKGTLSQDSADLTTQALGLQSLSSSNFDDDFKSNPLSSTHALLLILLFSFSLLLHPTTTPPAPLDVRSNNRSISDPHHPLKVQIEKNISPNITIKIEKNDGTPQKTTKRVLRHDKSTNNNRSVKRRKDEPQTKPSQSSSILDSQSVIPHITHRRPNTTYLLCNNVSQIVHPKSSASERQQSQSPSLISLLIPPDAMGTTSRDNSLLEVTCQVMDVSFVPIR
jgi:hypothetical protein